MALTNADSTQFQSPVTDFIPTDVNANVPAPEQKARVMSREASILFDKAIVARPLMTPEVCNLHVKNTEYAYRWVKDSMKRLRQSQGFTNADNNDVRVLSGDISDKDGEIRAYDVILMKIRQDLYDAAIKYNEQMAIYKERQRGVYFKENPITDVNSDEAPARASIANEGFARTQKAAPFIPTNPDAIVEDSIRSGRVDKTRKTVASLRKEE